MRLIIFLALNLTSLMAFSKTGYDVEVIIFEDLSGSYKNSENWPMENKAVDLPVTIKIDESLNPNVSNIETEETITNQKNLDRNHADAESRHKKDTLSVVSEQVLEDTVKMDFEFLDLNEFRLSKQAEKLKQHKSYNILYHRLWKQVGLDKEHAKALHINTQTDNNKITDSKETSSVILNDGTSYERTTEIDKTSNPVAKNTSFLVGDFTLIMSRYLHVSSTMTLYQSIEPVIAENNVELNNYEQDSIPVERDIQTSYTSYPIKFERRMRSKEIHYIDHPMGGMIVLATPYKIEDSTAQ